MELQKLNVSDFFKVDKISDDVYVIGPNVILRFSVSLSKTSNGKRYHFYKEYEYPSKQIEGQPSLITIKRSFDYYLSIESAQKDQNGNKVFIRIGTQEFMLFKRSLDEAVSWFTDSRFEKLFASNHGQIVLTAPIPNTVIHNLPMQKYLEIRPIIIDHGLANADKEPGVRITLSDPSTYIDINVDRLMGLHYIVSGFNMYQSAQLLLNYLQRPEIGTGRISLGTENNSAFNSTSNIDGRFVTPKQE